jgi:hypoxanthine phosphoribosyltransferase
VTAGGRRIMTKVIRKYNWRQIDTFVNNIADQIKRSGNVYKVLFGIPRGGLIPATILSHILEIPIVTTFDTLWTKSMKDVLVVDDIVDSGETLKEYADFYHIASIFWKKYASFMPKYYSEIAYPDEWIVFPWETKTSDKISNVNLD